VTPGPFPDLDGWVGEAAMQAVDAIMSSRPPRFVDDIFAVTVEEQKCNFCGPFVTRGVLDHQYGKGHSKGFSLSSQMAKSELWTTLAAQVTLPIQRWRKQYGPFRSTALQRSPAWSARDLESTMHHCQTT